MSNSEGAAGDVEQEWEIKCEYSEALWQSLLSLPLVPEEKAEHSEDVYLDTATGTLYRQGYFLRVRGERLLQLKYTPGAENPEHVYSVEHRMSWPPKEAEIHALPDVFSNALAVQRGTLSWRGDPLVELTRVSKQRRTWRADSLVISVDDVVGLGRFIECEANTIQSREQLFSLRSRYKMGHLPVGYVELMLRHTRPELYLQGRYVLRGDREAGGLENPPALPS